MPLLGGAERPGEGRGRHSHVGPALLHVGYWARCCPGRRGRPHAAVAPGRVPRSRTFDEDQDREHERTGSVEHRSTDPLMTTCTRCRHIIERTPLRSGACPGWPCHAATRPDATDHLEALLQPGPDAVPPWVSPSASPPGAAVSPPRRPEASRARSHADLRLGAPARQRGEQRAGPHR